MIYLWMKKLLYHDKNHIKYCYGKYLIDNSKS